MEMRILKGHLIVRAALAGGPAHGYDIIQESKRWNGSAFDLPEGTIYRRNRDRSRRVICLSFEIEVNRKARIPTRISSDGARPCSNQLIIILLN